AYSLRKPDGF
ncbi:amidohydrolase family protein, partial [Vibrio parahaemolyticus AQ3810]